MFNIAFTKKPEPRRAAATQSQYSWQIRLRLSGQRVLPHCPYACLLRIGLHELQQSGYIFFLRTESLRQLLFVSWKGVTFYLILFWILVFSWSGHPKSEDYATTRALLANLQLHLPYISNVHSFLLLTSKESDPIEHLAFKPLCVIHDKRISHQEELPCML